MVRKGEVSATELVGLCLDRIQRLDPQLNSFRVVLAEQRAARGRAGRGAVRAAGRTGRCLDVPIAIKDEVDVAGEVNPPRHRRLG